MLAKRFLDAVLTRLTRGGLRVTYWDGTTRAYGAEPANVHVIIHDAGVVRAMRKSFVLAFGEAYMDGRVDVEGDLADVARLAEINTFELAKVIPLAVRRVLDRRPDVGREKFDAGRHYDLGNDFYALWLDPSMTYSCAYFEHETDALEVAQRRKIDHILRKLRIAPGMTLLDIGCGWGELVIRAASRFGARAHGVTVSHEQLERAERRIRDEGLAGRASVELAHYAELSERPPYDRVVSVGMFEHVGREHHGAYMEAVGRLLVPGGLSLLHTITQLIARPVDPWIDRYIFPGGELPTLDGAIAHAAPAGLRVLDVESLRRHYALTLDAWWRRFEDGRDAVRAMYDERFVRMWRLYLRGAYAGFRWGNLDLHQILFSKGPTDAVPLTRADLYG